MSKNKCLKVLISAYSCVPGSGSEPGVGWNWVEQVSRFHDVWLITSLYNKKYWKENFTPKKKLHIVWYDLPKWTRIFKRELGNDYLYYFFWQLGIFFKVRELHKRCRFDILHHITYGVHWLPSFIALLPIPFVWGPLGGGESTPPRFYKTYNVHGKTLEAMRTLARWIGEKSPIFNLGAKKTKVILAKTEETKQRFSASTTSKIRVFSESGISEKEIQQLNIIPLRYKKPFRIISIGRLLYWKGFHLGLFAFAKFCKSFNGAEYWIVGNGPEKGNLEKLAQNLGIADKIKFTGYFSRKNVLKTLENCDVLLHPSLHDSGGWVCLEAMAAGRPVICLNLGGPALQVTEKAGFKIPAVNPDQAIDGISNALSKLANDFEMRKRMSDSARQHVVTNFTWDKKGEQINAIYNKIAK